MAFKFKFGLYLLLIASCSVNAQDPYDIAEKDAQIAASSLQAYKEAAIAIYQSTGSWPTSVAALNAQMPAQPKLNGKYVSPTLTVNSNGSISISVQASTNEQAKRLASQQGEVFTQTGNSVSMLVTPPTGTNLRSVYKEQVESNVKSKFSVIDDMSLGNKNILNAANINTNTLNISCLELGSSKVCESAAGELTVATDLARLSLNGQVDETVTADVVNVINKIKSKDMSLAELVSANTVATDLIVTAANIDQSQINTLDAISASMKSVAVKDLKVTGSTKLADLIANDATLASLTGTDINVSGKAVMNTLTSNGLLAGNAFVDSANVQSLVTNIATLINLKSNLVQTNRLLANQGLLSDIQSVTANYNTAVVTNGDVNTLNTNSFKGKVVDLGAAVIKATLTVNDLNVKRVESDFSNIKNLQSDLATISEVKSTNASVSGKTQTGTLNVTGDAVINGNATVANDVSTKDLNVSQNLNVANILTSMRMVVNNDAIIAGLLTTKDLVVTQDATVSNTMTVTNLATSANMNVANSTSAKSVAVSGNANVTGNASANAVTANGAVVSGITKANQVQSTSMTANSVNATNWVSDKLTAKSLISQYNATLSKAVVQSLNSKVSQLGTSSGESLTLTGAVSATNGTFQSLQVSAKGLLGSFEANSAVFKSDLTVKGKISSLNLNADVLNSAKSNITSINTSSLSASGLITGGTVKTTAGNSLASVNNIYVNHEGRIISIEQFRTECINNWVYACAGTIPKIQSPTCVGCTQNSYSSGAFTALASATITDCPAGCTYSWGVGSGLAKSSCSNGSVPAGQSALVKCQVSSSPAIGINKSLASNINLDVKHSQKGSINTGNDYPVNWTFTGESPSITGATCPYCQDRQVDLGVFNATFTATIGNCSAGCNYEWVFGNGVGATNCPSGAVPAGSSRTVACQINASPLVGTGTTLNSSLSLNVINSQLASLKNSYPQVIRWENKENIYTPIIKDVSCKYVNTNGDCGAPGVGNFGYLDVLLTYTIENCLPTCVVTTTLGAGLTAVSCAPFIANGALTTATCRVKNTFPLAQGESLSTKIALIRAESTRDPSRYHEVPGPSLNLQNGNAPVASPSVSLACTGCVDSASGKSNFTAEANANVSTCAGGCTYSWILGAGLTKNICSNGSVNSNGSASPSCTFKNTSSLSAGQKLSSTVSLTATNITDASKKTTRSFNVSWENQPVADPFDRVRAGCWVDTHRYDRVTEQTCVAMVTGSSSVAFSVGDTYTYDNENYAFVNPADWTISHSGYCQGSSSTCLRSVPAPINPGVFNFRNTITITHKPTGVTRTFTVLAEVEMTD